MNLKKMIVAATLSSIVLMVLIISVFAAWSPNYVLLCPKFGGWSNPSPRVQKTDSNNAVLCTKLWQHRIFCRFMEI